MSASRGRVLVVDDNELNLRVLADMLERAGYSIIAASGAEGALGLIKDAIADVILLDVMMQNMDGYELCRKLHAVPGMKNTEELVENPNEEKDPSDIRRRLEIRRNYRKRFQIDSADSICVVPDRPGGKGSHF